ncbi:MAG: tetratricopeptide repeat protein [Pseudomonadota bacterium]
MSAFSQLAARRVPQIMGLYVAGTWMAIEIGDWLIEKFALPERLTAFIFVAMAAMLPAVALVAWNHGAPGRDRWTRAEKVWLPINAVIALVLIAVIARSPTTPPPVAAPEPATQMMTVVDESGEQATFEVAMGKAHRRMLAFFMTTATPDLDALGYELPFLIAHDLNHESPLVTVLTPFTGSALRERLQERGFADLRGEPRALQMSLTRESNSDAFLSGEISRTESGDPQVDITLVNAKTGVDITSERIALDDLLAGADRISQLVQDAMDLDPDSDQENDPLTENLSNNVTAVKKAVEAIRMVTMKNDYASAIQNLREALELDPTFADANSILANFLFLSGDPAGAVGAVEEALKYDYKLSTSEKFLSKVRRYVYANDIERGLKVLELWTQIEPQNPKPFELLGQVLSISGLDSAGALDAYQMALTINPARIDLLKAMTVIEQNAAHYVEAAELAQRFINARPEDPSGHQLLAGVYLAANDFVQARSAYVDAELLASDNLEVTLGLANLSIREGKFDQARTRLTDALSRNLTPQQRVDALNTMAELDYATGRVNDMLGTLDAMDAEAVKFLPPIIRTLQIGMTRVASLATVAKFEDAYTGLEQVRAELQSPFDGFVHIPEMSLLWLEGRREDAMAALDLGEAFAEQRSDPTYEMMLAYGRTHRAVYNQNVESARAEAAKAVQLMDSALGSAASSLNRTLEFQVELAVLLHEVGALDTAQDLLEQALRRAPFLASAHLALAQLFADLEQTDRALAAVNQALSIWARADDGHIKANQAKTLRAQLTRDAS